MSIYFYLFLKTSPSRLTMFSFLYDLFFFQSRNGFWWWQMTTIIQTSRVLLSGRADHNTWTFHQTHQLCLYKTCWHSQSSSSEDNQAPCPKAGASEEGPLPRLLWFGVSRRGKMVQAPAGQLTQVSWLLHLIIQQISFGGSNSVGRDKFRGLPGSFTI